MSDIRAITVKQPWAWAIAQGGKTVENRTQNFSYRGPIAVHAGKAWSKQGGQDAAVLAAFERWRPAYAAGQPIDRADTPERFPTAAIVAVADIVDVHVGDGCCRPWGQLQGPNGADVFHLVLADVRPLDEPVPARGALGLWRPSTEVVAAVEEQIGALP